MNLLVMAKEPVPGQVKTRLCPPFSEGEAAAIAEAALADTLDAVAACGADRRIVALAGRAGPWLPSGFDLIPQIDGPFDARLAAAWSTVGGPCVQIGMDTPQVTAALLDAAMAALDDRPAALGPARDGGWWAIGLRRADPAVFVGVPMSTAWTGRCQQARLRSLGMKVARLPTLVDLDTASDLPDIVAAAPRSRTAALALTAATP